MFSTGEIGRISSKMRELKHKVATVKPETDYKLLVGFVSGEKKIYDVKPLLSKWAAFRALAATKGLFEAVRVDVGGYGIVWNDDIDLSCDELYENGQPA